MTVKIVTLITERTEAINTYCLMGAEIAKENKYYRRREKNAEHCTCVRIWKRH